MQLHSSNKKIDTAFIVFLFFLFSVTACLLALITATQYRSTVTSMEQNSEVRTVSTYLTKQIHRYDTGSGISITDFCENTALALSENRDGEAYTTYIYYYDGALRELPVNVHVNATADVGEAIANLSGFDVTWLKKDLLQITFIDTSGTQHSLILALHAASGKEAA